MKKESINKFLLVGSVFILISFIALIIPHFKPTLTGNLISELNEESTTPNYASNEILVKYNSDIIITDKEVIKELAIAEGVNEPSEIKEVILNKNLNIYNLKFNKEINMVELIDEYAILEDFEYVEPNYILTVFNSLNPFIIPSDTRYSDQWGLPNINAPLAWNLTTGDSSVIIAVVDTGVDWNHPDLSLNIWNNTGDDCNDSTDLDNNGYNGDCRGYDFTDINTTWYEDNGYNLDNNEDYNITDNNPMDYHSHGTYCSGIAAAVANNNLGVAGVCWNCTIMPVRAGFRIQHPTEGWVGSLEIDDVSNALYYAADMNSTIISMSFGGSDSSTMQDAIDYAYAKNSILVASSGNSGANSKQYPCAYNNVICVAATDSDNTSASYSNYGNWINLSAPGTGIWSTGYDDTYSNPSGTSMSTPMVAGAIGLIKTLFLEKNQIEIETILNNTGSPVNFSGTTLSKINIYSAILSLDETNPSVNLSSPADNHFNLSANQTFECNASDWQLKNITLQIWNSTNDLYYNSSINISGTFDSVSFNVTNMDYDRYKWNCLVYDEENNYDYAGTNFTLIIENITVSLISPINGTNSNQTSIEFNCSVQTESNNELTNLTFSLWNSSNLIYNSTQKISGKSNTTNFSYEFNSEKTYYWNCEAYNNETQNAIGDNNFTFIYDSTSPLINILNPNDGSSYTSNSQSINFNYNISETNEIRNCTMIINNIPNSTESSINKNSASFSITFGVGSYNWNINCTDNANNIGNSTLRSFSVIAPPASTTSSSGGGGGGGSITSAKTHIISNQQISQGYTKSLKKSDKIQFVFFDKEAEKHTLSINEIGKDYIDLIIQSNPIKLKLGIGQSAKLNLSSPDYYDLFIKLNSIQKNEAEITIQLIYEEIPKQKPITGKNILETNNEVEEKPEKKFEENVSKEIKELKILVNTLVVIIIIIILFVLFRERKYIIKKIRNFHLIEHKKNFNKHVRPKKELKGV